MLFTLLQDAANRGSVPLAIVGLSLCQVHPDRADALWDALTSEQQGKITFLLTIAMGDQDFKRIFSQQSEGLDDDDDDW